MYDFVIEGGLIVDGSGAPPWRGSIGVKDGSIVRLGTFEGEALERVDARGLVLAPGFIDGHNHSDIAIFADPLRESKLRQGITTEVCGNCGLAPAPCIPEKRDMLQTYVEPVIGAASPPWRWTGIDDYFKALSGTPKSTNIAAYAAHGSIRIAVMGFEKRQASATERARMKEILEEAMAAGAIGLSIGLLYAPGSYADEDELIELCSVLPKHGGILAAHIRGEGNSLLPSLEEVIRIAQRSGATLEISHLKAAGRRNWGKVGEALDLIESARTRGLDVSCDVYPYDAGSTMLSTLIPPWALEGGTDAMLRRLASPEDYRRIAAELGEEREDWDNLVASTGWKSVVVSSARTETGRACIGMNIEEIAEKRGIDPVDCALDLLYEERGHISIVYYHMSQEDVDRVIADKRSIIISDALGPTEGMPHPRAYGAFPRVFSEYVRGKKLLSLEEAVHKITTKPARRFGLERRGAIAMGYIADLTAFDFDKIRDRATYLDPTREPTGIKAVWVNGVRVMTDGVHTGKLPGRFIQSNKNDNAV